MTDTTKPTLLVWMDMEMSGLDPRTDRVLEMATLVTDGDLKVVAEGPELVIHQSESVLEAMDEWNRTHHGDSGLTNRVRESTLDEAEAERLTLEFIAEHCPPQTAPLAGNSIWQDRRFLVEYMPLIDAHLHYRLVDVSSVKELVRRWRPEVLADAPRKAGAHRALEDILESVAELRFYRERIFSAPSA